MVKAARKVRFLRKRLVMRGFGARQISKRTKTMSMTQPMTSIAIIPPSTQSFLGECELRASTLLGSKLGIYFHVTFVIWFHLFLISSVFATMHTLSYSWRNMSVAKSDSTESTTLLNCRCRDRAVFSYFAPPLNLIRSPRIPCRFRTHCPFVGWNLFTQALPDPTRFAVRVEWIATIDYDYLSFFLSVVNCRPVKKFLSYTRCKVVFSG